LGFPKANLMSTFGIFAPAKTPQAIIERLNAVFNAVLDMAKIRSLLSDSDDFLLGDTAERFAALIAQEASGLRIR
jgi:tripartite-type tricarboxylate transporter receptor subunit TctC